MNARPHFLTIGCTILLLLGSTSLGDALHRHFLPSHGGSVPAYADGQGSTGTPTRSGDGGLSCELCYRAMQSLAVVPPHPGGVPDHVESSPPLSERPLHHTLFSVTRQQRAPPTGTR